MNGQLALVDVQPAAKLTERQQAVLDALQRAGHDGLDADQAGAIAHELKAGRWQHSRDERCLYCAQDGLQILRRLRDLGLARYRRANRSRSLPGVWLAADVNSDPARDLAAERVHYNEFPPGF